MSSGKLRVERTIEHGYMVVEVTMPTVLAVTKAINTPRIPSVSSISAAYKKKLILWTAKDIGLEGSRVGLDGSPTRVADMLTVETKRRNEMLEGSPEEVARQLAWRLHELGVL
jgi:electron transfer flavoprotein beta subunit